MVVNKGSTRPSVRPRASTFGRLFIAGQAMVAHEGRRSRPRRMGLWAWGVHLTSNLEAKDLHGTS